MTSTIRPPPRPPPAHHLDVYPGFCSTRLWTTAHGTGSCCHYAMSRRILANAFGGGVIGNTPGSGPVIEGSSPSPRARQTSVCLMAPSSRGLGRRPLKAVAWVQIPSGLRTGIPCSARDSARFGWAACRAIRSSGKAGARVHFIGLPMCSWWWWIAPRCHVTRPFVPSIRTCSVLLCSPGSSLPMRWCRNVWRRHRSPGRCSSWFSG